MHLYLIRHAIAVPRADESLDHARPLTAKGRDRFEQSVQTLGELGVSLDRVYHSPWVRARQTAELLGPLSSGELVETEGLARSPSETLLEELRGESVALVGHEPWMGELLALLLLGEPDKGLLFHFKKGGVAHLEGIPSAGGCELLTLWDPKVLRMAAPR
jgi:phosphohistidine phosphatase